MTNLKIGIVLTSLRLPLKKALHTAAQMGARGVQIDARSGLRPAEMSRTGIRQFRKMLDDLQLQVCSVAYPTRRGYDTQDDLDRRIAGTKEAMQFAYDLGAAVVVNHIGAIPEDSEGGSWQTLIEALTDLGMHGQHTGAILCAKTAGVSGTDLARLLAALPESLIGIDLDPGRLIHSGQSVPEAVTVLGPEIQHVTASDGVWDLASRRGSEVQLGRGTVDYPELLGTLEEFNYRGWLTIERRESSDPVTEIAQSIQFLQTIALE